MPTPTERHLQVIAEKIETIQNLQQSSAGAIPTGDIQTITAELQEIGRTVLLLPESFTERYSDVPWGEMAHWASSNAFAGVLTSHQLSKMTCQLDEAEREITRHTETNKEMMTEIINSLNLTYEQYQREWYAYIRIPYLLVTFSGALLLVRLQLSSIELNVAQVVIYFIHLATILFILIEIQFSKNISSVYIPSVSDHHTLTEFYESKANIVNQKIKDFQDKLNNRKSIRQIIFLYWIVSLLFSVLYTTFN